MSLNPSNRISEQARAEFSGRPENLTPDWVFERSSGYDGYRNMYTGEWRYAKELR